VAVRLDEGSSSFGPEGYLLEIGPSRIVLSAPRSAGLFYARQTLRQLMEATGGILPCLRIEDAPRFPWRGFMLDEARHFQGPAVVRSLLDAMAGLKMNVFHWHLTDDQGWRIEIRRHPRLTEVGSARPGTRLRFLGASHDGIPHAGFYTQEQIRDIVAYAAERHIAVVPEIEMPGHCLSALAAYPDLGCTRGPYAVATGPGISRDVACVGRESTASFFQDVLEEVMACFPGELVHIGGDETPRDRWRRCPDCLRLAREAGVGPGDVQVLFTNRMASFLRERGRRAVGWDEILAPGLGPEAVAQHWRPGTRRIVEAVRAGRDVVLSPFLDLYLDHSYDLTPLARTWRFPASLPGCSGPEARHVLGIEAPLWSEFVGSPGRLGYQAFPRLLACAERAWTKAAMGDYVDFRRRVEGFLPRLAALGISCAPKAAWDPPLYKRMFGMLSIFQPQTGGG
jgi:hexosaminidase